MSGQQLALVGMALADLAAGNWKDRWDAAITELARAGVPFTTDEVRELAGAPEDHPNAAGARIQDAARKGLIARIGYRKSAREALHAHPLALWQGTAKAGRI